MEVTLRPINFDSLVDFDNMIKWYTDETIKHLFTVDFNQGPTLPQEAEDLRQAKLEASSNTTYIIEVDGIAIGDAAVDTAFEMVKGPKEHTGWLSICIGEKAYQGKGLGYKIMASLESLCQEKGLTRLELGVFAYNQRAIHFYEKLGYRHFYTVEDFTWYKGAWHNDLRMEKYI